MEGSAEERRVAELEVLRDSLVPVQRPGWVEWRRRGWTPAETWEWLWLTRLPAVDAA